MRWFHIGIKDLKVTVRDVAAVGVLLGMPIVLIFILGSALGNLNSSVGKIPVDAVTTSGSGLDPDISPAYARLQATRIAAVRHLPLARVLKLIGENTDGRSFSVLGEPGVNVLALNLALDKEH